MHSDIYKRVLNAKGVLQRAEHALKKRATLMYPLLSY